MRRTKGAVKLEIISVEQKLQPEGLLPPCLNALQADDSLYTLLAYQPEGLIRITPDSIGHFDSVEATRRTLAFLQLAATPGGQPDLVVSPEYSVPWEALVQAIEHGAVPEEGKLWVLGCESLPLDGLEGIRQRLGQRAIVLDDDVFPSGRTTQRYRDPLVYAFQTKKTEDQSTHLVLLIQYKTVPSGDPQNTEATGMLPGVYVYAFGALPNEVRLITLICSDVFGFRKDLIDQIYKGLFLLHIQLNNSPRHVQYKKYRQELFAPAGETELLCLNWADNVISVDGSGTNQQSWKNICGSAWYLCSPETDLSDNAIVENHRHGVYYTRHEPIRAHAFQFNYRPRVFLFRATKVFHHAIPKPRSTRTGPTALKTFVWAQDHEGWLEPRTPEDLPDDGFREQLSRVASAGPGLDDVLELYRNAPIAVERAMAITAGQFGVPDDWHKPARIDSMRLCEHEFVRRVTVTQDPDAAGFRDERFARTGAVAELRDSDYSWPSSVQVIRDGFKFDWLPRFANRNVVAEDGTRATIVNAGLVVDHHVLDRLDQKVRMALAGAPPEPERELSAQLEEQRLDEHYATRAERFCIIYMTATGGAKNYLSGRDTSITRQSGQSAVDIGVPSPVRLAENPHEVQE